MSEILTTIEERLDRVAILRVGDTDTLVFTAKGQNWRREQVEAMKKEVASLFPGVKVCLLTGGIELTTVIRQGEEPEGTT